MKKLLALSVLALGLMGAQSTCGGQAVDLTPLENRLNTLEKKVNELYESHTMEHGHEGEAGEVKGSELEMLQKKIARLEKKNADLERRVSSLEKAVKTLMRR